MQSGSPPPLRTTLPVRARPAPADATATSPAPRHPLAWLALAGGGSILTLAGIFTLLHPLVPYSTVPLILYRAIPSASPERLAVGWLALFGLYYLSYRICPAGGARRVTALIGGVALAGSGLLFVMHNIGSNDIFDQLFRGHMAAQYGANPFTTRPDAFKQDPWFVYTFWRDQIATGYGPVWEILAGITSRLAGGNLLANVLAYKLLVTAHFWAGMPLVAGILRQMRPQYVARGLLLYAWNPLLQFEFAGNGHNDAIMICWLLAAIYLLVRGRHTLALVALAGAIFIKFIPLLLLPLFLAVIWRRESAIPSLRRLARLVGGVAALGAVGVLLYLPFGLDSLGANLRYLSSRGDLFHASIYRAALYILVEDRGVRADIAAQWLSRIALGVVGLAVGGATVGLLVRHAAPPRRLLDRFLRGGYEVLFIYLLLACLWFQPWYVTWLLVFTPLVVGGAVIERTTLVGLAALSEYFLWHYAWPQQFDFRTAEFLLVGTIYVLPLLATVVAGLHAMWWGRRHALYAAH